MTGEWLGVVCDGWCNGMEGIEYGKVGPGDGVGGLR